MVYPTQLLVYDNKAGTGEYIGTFEANAEDLQLTIVPTIFRGWIILFCCTKTSSDPYVEWTSSENQTAQHDKHVAHVVKKTHMNCNGKRGRPIQV